MKVFKDGTLKFAILNYILNHPECTSQDIAQHVQHESIQVLRSEIYYLKRQSYLTVNDRKERPLRYSTTKSGQKEALQGPHSVQIKRQERQERVHAMVMSILNDDERFSAAVADSVKTQLREIATGTREAPIIETVEKPVDDSALIQELNEKGLRIQELEAQVQHLKLHKSNVPTRPPPVEKSPEEQKAENERRQRREQLAMRYRGMLLDAPFFHHWKDMFPFKMKHMELYKTGSVEIMSPSNPEHRRGHARRPLSPAEVIGAQFHITKMTKAGIVIQGKGLPGGQVSLRW